jgi:hypothetical protein
MQFLWAHLGGIVLYPALHPDKPRDIQLLHVRDPKSDSLSPNDKLEGCQPDRPVIDFNLVSRPNSRNHLVEPGRYRVELQVCARNAKAVTRTLIIHLQDWYLDASEMVARGIQFEWEK